MDLKELKKILEEELKNNILNYWVKEVYDAQRKTFIGKISIDGKKFPESPLSAVFTTRILWTFSAAYRLYPVDSYKKMAEEAFRILLEHFWDPENGGIFWSIFPDGKPNDKNKQFYAQAFFIYAMSEYYLTFKDPKANHLAISMFMLMEGFAWDNMNGGYLEATEANWEVTDDQYLSPDDKDIKKTMNTHLHILEAYSNLYRIYKDESLKERLEQLIRIFLDKILDGDRGHLNLFFDLEWKVKSDIDSYGHDIEASWLLCEAADVLGKKELIEEVEKVAEQIAEVTLKEGFGKENGLYYETQGDHLLERYDWWPQAESVVGFFNAWQISGKKIYMEQAIKSWDFIKNYIVDKANGEWFWGVDADLEPLDGDKAGPWKAPYHNGRMCMEMIERIVNST